MLTVWMLACDVFEAKYAEQRRLEGRPVFGQPRAVLSGAQVAAAPAGGQRIPTVHGGLASMRARKMKRMDRRPTHWRCAFCRQENAVAEQRSVYNTGNGQAGIGARR